MRHSCSVFFLLFVQVLRMFLVCSTDFLYNSVFEFCVKIIAIVSMFCKIMLLADKEFYVPDVCFNICSNTLILSIFLGCVL